jgi:NAD(P)H dehydrogenase (quinone)
MTIAITAASGRLGHAILRELAGQGLARNTVAVARDPRRVQVAGIEARAGDYGSVAGMTAALAGVRRVLFTSVIGNGREMDTLFGPTQRVNRQTESDLQASGLEWVIGRNGLYLELDLIQMRKAGETGVYSNPAGEGRCPYITIDEIACAYARLAVDGQQAGQIYNITSENLTQAELLGLAAEIFGLEVRYEALSDEDCIAKFRKLMPERGEAVAHMLTGCFQSIRAGAFDVPSHFREAAGRPPKTVRQMLEGLAMPSGRA